MSRPKLLDLFCCEGGAGVGYDRAGFDVYGVDLDGKFAKRYPFSFTQGDALAVLRTLMDGGTISSRLRGTVDVELRLSDFDAIHASPPCQGYTRGNAGRDTSWPKLIGPVRDLLIETGLPYVIENVRDAAPHMFYPQLLCGCMFDMSVQDFTCTSPGQHDGTCDTKNGVTVHLERGRLFETNWAFKAPRPCEGMGQPRNNHPSHDWVAGAYGGARRDKYEARYIRKGGYVPPDMRLVKELLGIDHDMTWNGLFECIPPAYTYYIGGCLRLALHDISSSRRDSIACSTCTYLNRVQSFTTDPVLIERVTEQRARHLEAARRGPVS